MKIFFVFILSAIAFSAISQVPSNDNCSGAIELPVSSFCDAKRFDLLKASESLPRCSALSAKDVWFKFKATDTLASITVSGLLIDPVIQMFDSGCGTTPRPCMNKNSTTIENALLTGLKIGQTYFFRVYDNRSSMFTGIFDICITGRLSNDDCSGAIEITPVTNCTNNSQIATLAFATQSQAGCTGNAYDDVWFKFMAVSSTASITALNTGVTPLTVQAFNGACGSSQKLCQSNGGSLTGLTIGQYYYFRVYTGSLTPATSSFTVCVTQTTAQLPPNDNCAGAIELFQTPLCDPVKGTILNAKTSTSICNGGYTDVWYKFTATSTETEIEISAVGFDPGLQVLDGNCSTSYYCAGNTGKTLVASMKDLTIGNLYYVRIYSPVTQPTYPDFTVCIHNPESESAPPNDECANATLLSVNSNPTWFPATVDNATLSTDYKCAGVNIESDVWFKFVATETFVHINYNSSFIPFIQVNDGACGTAAFTCDVSQTTNGNVSMNGLTLGKTYYFRVAKNTVDKHASWFNISIDAVLNNPASNNQCANAVPLSVNSTTIRSQGSVGKSTQSLVGCKGTADDDVWFTFVPATSSAVIKVFNAGFDPVIEVLDGGCAASSLGCRDTSSSNMEMDSLSSLVPGKTYTFRVYSYASSAPSNSSFVVAVKNGLTPENDNCSQAVRLNVNNDFIFTNGTLQNSAMVNSGCSFTDKDVWYSFTATGPSANILIDAPGFLPVLELFNGSCNSTSQNCYSVSSGQSITVLNGLTSGNTYTLRVSSNTGQPLTDSNFKIALSTKNAVTAATPTAFNNYGISISPNPVKDKIKIQLPELLTEKYSITILDASGHEVEGNVKADFIGGSYEILVSKFKPGLYIIRINNSYNQFFGKFLIEQ